MTNKKTITNRSAKITAATSKAAFRKPISKPDAFDTHGQFRILELTRQIKQIAGEYDEHGDVLWRLADEAMQLIEARN